MVATAALPARARSGSAALVASAKVAGGGSLVLLNLWVAQHLSPGAYGVFALATTLVLLMDGVIGSALDAAVIRTAAGRPASSPAEQAGVVMKLGAGLAVLLGATGWFLVQAPQHMIVAALAACAGTGLLLHRSALVSLQLREHFAWYATADLTLTVFRWLATVAVVAAGIASAQSMVGAYAAAAWVAALLFLGASAALRSSTVRTGSARVEAGRVARVAVVTFLTTGVGAIVARLDLLLIGVAGSTEEAGIFAAASTFALVPTWLGAYLAPTFTARIMPYARDGRLSSLLRSVQWRLLVVALVGTLAGIALAPMAMARLLPAEYGAAAQVVPVLLVAGAAGFVTFPLVLHTLLFLSPRTYLFMDLLSLPILVPLYLVAAGRWGAFGVACVSSGSAVVKAAIAQVAAASAAKRATNLALVEA